MIFDLWKNFSKYGNIMPQAVSVIEEFMKEFNAEIRSWVWYRFTPPFSSKLDEEQEGRHGMPVLLRVAAMPPNFYSGFYL